MWKIIHLIRSPWSAGRQVIRRCELWCLETATFAATTYMNMQKKLHNYMYLSSLRYLFRILCHSLTDLTSPVLKHWELIGDYLSKMLAYYVFVPFLSSLLFHSALLVWNFKMYTICFDPRSYSYKPSPSQNRPVSSIFRLGFSLF